MKLKFYYLWEIPLKGVAKQLLNKVKKWFDGKKVESIIVSLVSENKAALRFYKSLGFNNFKLELRNETY